MGKSELMCDCEVLHKDIVDKIKKNMLDEEVLLDMADFYKTMADSTRVKIIHALDLGELCVCDISVLLNMTKSAISHQLKNLKDGNLIKSRKEGKEIFYSLVDDHVKQMFEISLEHLMEQKCVK